MKWIFNASLLVHDEYVDPKYIHSEGYLIDSHEILKFTKHP